MQPQMQPDEPGIILSHLPENGLLVEWGSGGSTIWFMNHISPTQSIISIDHNPVWVEKVAEALKDLSNKDQHKYYYAPSKYNNAYATVLEELPSGLERYIMPGEDIWDADVYLIDGIARGACLLTVALKARKRPCTAFIHDYLGRDWYEWAKDVFDPADVEILGEIGNLLKITIR